MKSVVVTKIGQLRDPNAPDAAKLEVIDIPVDPVGPEDVKIKVAYCAICGSDPHCIQENIFGWPLPFGLGHEVSGVVTELGENATKKGLKVGDRVAGNFLKFCGTCYYCNNGQQQFCANADESNKPGMSEYVTWHESQVHKLPDNISLKEGCLLEPLAIAVRITDKARPKIGWRVAISGAGPIGLLTLQAFKMMGAVSLTMIEPIKARRDLALKYGAEHVIDPRTQDVVKTATELTGGRGYDLVVDCSGSVQAVGNLPVITAYCGTLMYSSMYPNDYEFPLNLYQYCYKNELTITGTYVAPYTFPRTVQLIEKFKLDEFTQKIFDLDDVTAAFAEQMTGKYPKILLRCNSFEGE